MIITLICCRCVAMWKEGEESSPLHTHIIACTNAHTHTHTQYSHTTHPAMMVSIRHWTTEWWVDTHAMYKRGVLYNFLSCRYISITMVKEVSSFWSQLTALTEESFSIGSCCLYWKVEVNRFILCIPTLPNVTCTWQSMHTNQCMIFGRETKCLRSSVDVAGIRRASNEAHS